MKQKLIAVAVANAFPRFVQGRVTPTMKIRFYVPVRFIVPEWAKHNIAGGGALEVEREI